MSPCTLPGDRELDPAGEGWLGLVLAVLPFALSTTLTPGPNTIMVTASGATFGFRRTVPHMLGILLGFPARIFNATMAALLVAALLPLLA